MAPIIFMTGLSDQEHVVKGLQVGGVDYITKPVIIEEMIARLTTHVVNSRLLQSARQVVEAIDRPVLAFDMQAGLAWGSEKAIALIESEAVPIEDPDFREWLRGCMTNPVSDVSRFQAETVSFQFIGFSSAREVLVKVDRRQARSNEDILQDAFALTSREAEVLYWLTLGKTNRDISAILSLSARTVNKHFEQVFQKMGVDNRTSAAVLADRKLNSAS
jgi:DNA-binding NarL/FixJ family response regulator